MSIKKQTIETAVPVKWSSRSAFLMAAVGAAIGLGNIWRFPYITGDNGGGAFVLIYIGFVLVIGFPLIMAELALGRAGKKSAINTMQNMIRKGGHNPFWKIIGWLSLLVPVMGLMYYSVVAGWSLEYIFKAVKGDFSNITADQSSLLFAELQGDWVTLSFWHSLYMISVIVIVGMGIKKGLETTVKFMMPSLFVILILLGAYAMITGDHRQTINFLFNPDFSKITSEVVLMALGQALFSLAIGVGALITYGAYLPKDIEIPKAAKIIAAADTGVALLAGFAIFPIVFQYNLAVGEGPGLIFVTLPIAFGQMTGGVIFGILFFILLTFAAFTSSIAMLEPVIAWYEDKGYSRKKMAWVAGGGIWAVGICVALSSNILAAFRPLGFIQFFEDKNLFSVLDYLVANLLLPLNALMIALFVGWVMSKEIVQDQLGLDPNSLSFKLWRFSVCILAPVSIIIIFYLKVTGSDL